MTPEEQTLAQELEDWYCRGRCDTVEEWREGLVKIVNAYAATLTLRALERERGALSESVKAMQWAKPYVGRLRDTEIIDNAIADAGKYIKT